jgi:hypothetical protein
MLISRDRYGHDVDGALQEVAQRSGARRLRSRLRLGRVAAFSTTAATAISRQRSHRSLH